MVCYLNDEVRMTNLHDCMLIQIWQKYNYMLNVKKSLLTSFRAHKQKSEKGFYWSFVSLILIPKDLYLAYVFANSSVFLFVSSITTQQFNKYTTDQ